MNNLGQNQELAIIEINGRAYVAPSVLAAAHGVTALMPSSWL